MVRLDVHLYNVTTQLATEYLYAVEYFLCYNSFQNAISELRNPHYVVLSLEFFDLLRKSLDSILLSPPRIERTLPLLQPFMRQYEGKTFHPLRFKHPKVVFLSVAAFPERDIFDPLSAWVRYIFGKGGNLITENYRPMAEDMPLAMTREQSADVLEAVCQAGHEIVDLSSVLPETLKQIHQPLLENNQAFVDIGNLMWKTCIAEGLTPEAFDKKGLVLRPDSIETFLIIMKMGFNASAAADTRAVIEFRFSQEREGACHLTIADGRIDRCIGICRKGGADEKHI